MKEFIRGFLDSLVFAAWLLVLPLYALYIVFKVGAQYNGLHKLHDIFCAMRDTALRKT